MMQHKQHHKPNQNWNLDDDILLDSSSTMKVKFIITDLVTNFKPNKNPLHMSTHTDTKKMILQGDTKKFGDVRYYPTHMANIFGISHLSEKIASPMITGKKMNYWYTKTV